MMHYIFSFEKAEIDQYSCNGQKSNVQKERIVNLEVLIFGYAFSGTIRQEAKEVKTIMQQKGSANQRCKQQKQDE